MLLILLRQNHCQKPLYYRPWDGLMYRNNSLMYRSNSLMYRSNSFPDDLRRMQIIALLYLLFGVRFGLVKPGLKIRYAIHFTATLGNKCNASSTLVRSLSGNSTVYSNPSNWLAGPCVARWSWRNISHDFCSTWNRRSVAQAVRRSQVIPCDSEGIHPAVYI